MRRKAAIAHLPSLPLRLSVKVFMATTTTNWSGHATAMVSMSGLLLIIEAIWQAEAQKYIVIIMQLHTQLLIILKANLVCHTIWQLHFLPSNLYQITTLMGR